MKKFAIAGLCAALSLGSASPALAWGPKGHTIVNDLAAQGFTGRMPAFVAKPNAQFEIAYLGPELDRMKGSGTSWDADNDQAHFLDLLDNGTIADAFTLTQLPPDREQYDTALRAHGTDAFRVGYLPYAILDGWEQLRDDFGYWRADSYAATHARSVQTRAYMAKVQALDQDIVLRDLGEWGHFVGDACQPLHVTVHFNGWGDYPNPNGYTQSKKTHAFFESVFVNEHVSEAQVEALVKPQSQFAVPTALISQEQMLDDIAHYLQTTASTVPQLYEIEKAGGFANGTPQAVNFTASRLAAGAAELRDLAVLAWQDSAYVSVGYPERSVQDILAGRAEWPQREGEE